MKLLLPTTLSLLGISLAFAFGCGGSDNTSLPSNAGGSAGADGGGSGGGGNTGPVPELVKDCGVDGEVGNACKALADNYCAKMFTCDEVLGTQSFWTKELCERTQIRVCAKQHKGSGARAGDTAVGATRITNMTCKDFLNDVGSFLPFAGIGQEGEACTPKTLCIGTEVLCSTETVGEVGVCEKPPAGIKCELVNSVYTCPTGLICNVKDEICVQVSNTKVPKGPDEPCNPSTDLCAGTYTCDSGKCIPAPPVEKQPSLGAPCAGPMNGLCGAGEACSGGDATTTGQCVASGNEGEACATNITSGQPCLGNLECAATMCGLPSCQ